jgi:hypothetical protein
MLRTAQHARAASAHLQRLFQLVRLLAYLHSQVRPAYCKARPVRSSREEHYVHDLKPAIRSQPRIAARVLARAGGPR